MSPCSPICPVAQQGAGGVHHVAFRTPDADYDAWADRLNEFQIPEQRQGRPLLVSEPVRARAERGAVRDRHGWSGVRRGRGSRPRLARQWSCRRSWSLSARRSSPISNQSIEPGPTTRFTSRVERMQQSHDPHVDQPVLRAGPSIADARLVAILLHGRGATAEDILGLSREFSAPDVTYLAPQASGQTWYPYSFLAPIHQNEPGISSALRVIAGLLQNLQRQDVSSDSVVLMGFSQGACLTLECAARHAQRYAAVVAFSGGLIGPPGTPRNYYGWIRWHACVRWVQ